MTIAGWDVSKLMTLLEEKVDLQEDEGWERMGLLEEDLIVC